MFNALILTILVGLFFLIGIIIPMFFKNKEKLLLISTSITFIIMIYLNFFDLLPEIVEIFKFNNYKNIIIVLTLIFIGSFILKVIDIFIPEHNHEHNEKHDNQSEHDNHLFHIGLITSISLLIHNILEGISIYVTGIQDFKIGLIMAITVGVHNLPIGVEVATSLNKSQNKLLKMITLLSLTFSSFIGAFVLFLLNQSLNEIIEGTLLSLTFGMIMYIAIFELLKEIKQNIKQKEVKLGIIIGIIFSVILYFI